MQKLTILNPRVAERATHTPIAPQLAALRDVKIAFVDNSKVNADVFLSRVRSLLEQKYGVRAGLTVRKLAPKDELTAADVKQLAEHDAVIQCFGDCGTSTSITVADGVKLERMGVPTATVISTAFSRAARLQVAGIAAAGSAANAPVVGFKKPGCMLVPPRRMPEWKMRPSSSRCMCG